MKKLYYFFVKFGEICFIFALLTIISISLQSLTVKGKVNYGDRCYQDFDDGFLKENKYEGIEFISGKLECNTYYLVYDSNLSENDNLKVLLSISKLMLDNNININLHVVMRCDDYQMLSTIVDYKVSYIISRL